MPHSKLSKFLILASFFSWTGLFAQGPSRSEGTLTIPRIVAELSDKAVHLEAQNSALTNEQSQAIRDYLQQSYPLRSFIEHGGKVNFTISGPAVEQIQRDLKATDLNDRDRVGEVFRQAIIDNNPFGPHDFRQSTVIVGRPIQLENEPSSDSLILIGGEGSIARALDDAIIIGSRVTFQEGAKVRRSLVAIGSQIDNPAVSLGEAQRMEVIFPNDPVAWVKSLANEENRRDQRPWTSRWMPLYFYGSLASLFLSLLFGSLYVYFFPNFLEDTRSWLSLNKGEALGLGFLAYVFLGVLSISLIMTLIGILLIPSILFLFTLFSILGYFTTAFAIGYALIAQRKPTTQSFWWFLLGLLILQLLGHIPFLGWICVQLLAMTGLGAVLHSLYSKFRPARRAV